MPLHDVEKIIRQDPLEDYYDVGNELGRGKFAIVKKCTEKSSGEQFAAKVLKKRRRGKSCREEILVEIDIMRQANEAREHPRIIRLHEVFESSHEFFIILELATGGELFRVIAIDPLPEEKAREVVYQIVDGVQHLHALNIVHLDLKPENILLYRKGQLDIKIADFGLSVQVKEGQEMKTLVGTAEYVSPEILNFEPLSTFTDMWSIGALTYALLTGYSPFQGETHQETFLNVSQCDYDFDDEVFDVVSQEAKDFIELLLVHVPRKRMSSLQCLEHPWMKARKTNLNSSTTSLDSALCMDSPSSVEPSPASSTSSSFSPAPSSSTTSHSTSTTTTSTVTTTSSSGPSYSQPEDMHKVNEKLNNISTLATERHMAGDSATGVPTKPREKTTSSPTGTDSSSSTLREDGSVESLSSLVNEAESSLLTSASSSLRGAAEKGRGEASTSVTTAKGGSSGEKTPLPASLAVDVDVKISKKDEGKSVYSRGERERTRKTEPSSLESYGRDSKVTPSRERIKSENTTDGNGMEKPKSFSAKTSPCTSMEAKEFKKNILPSRALESKDLTKPSDRKYTSRSYQSDEAKAKDVVESVSPKTSSIKDGKGLGSPRDLKSATLGRHYTSSYTNNSSSSKDSTPSSSKDVKDATPLSSRYDSTSENRYKSSTLGRTRDRDVGGVSRFNRDYDLLGMRSKFTDNTSPRNSSAATSDKKELTTKAEKSPTATTTSTALKSSILSSPKLKGKHHRPITPEPTSPDVTDVMLLRSPDRWGRRKSEGMKPIPHHLLKEKEREKASSVRKSETLVEEGDSSGGEDMEELRGSPVERERRGLVEEDPKKSTFGERDGNTSPSKARQFGSRYQRNYGTDTATPSESKTTPTKATPTEAKTSSARASSETPTDTPRSTTSSKESRQTYSSENLRRSANATPTNTLATPTTTKDQDSTTAVSPVSTDSSSCKGTGFTPKRSESTRHYRGHVPDYTRSPRATRGTHSSENVRADAGYTPSSSSKRSISRQTSNSESSPRLSPTPKPGLDEGTGKGGRRTPSSENLQRSVNSSPTPSGHVTPTQTAVAQKQSSKPSSPTPVRSSSKPPSPSPSLGNTSGTKPPSPAPSRNSKPPSPVPLSSSSNGGKTTTSKYTSCTANLFTTNNSPFTAEETRPYTSVLRRTTDTSKRGDTLPRSLSSMTRSPVDQAWRESSSGTNSSTSTSVRKLSSAPVRGGRSMEGMSQQNGEDNQSSKKSSSESVSERPVSRGSSPLPKGSSGQSSPTSSPTKIYPATTTTPTTSGGYAPRSSRNRAGEEKTNTSSNPSSKDSSPNRISVDNSSPIHLRKSPPSARRGYVKREQSLLDKLDDKATSPMEKEKVDTSANKPHSILDLGSPEIVVRSPSLSETNNKTNESLTDIKLRKKSPLPNHLVQSKQMRRQTPVISEDAVAMILSGKIPDLDEDECENPLYGEGEKLETCMEEEEPSIKKFSPVASQTGSRSGSRAGNHTPILKSNKSTSPDHASVSGSTEKRVSISSELSVHEGGNVVLRPRRKFLSAGSRALSVGYSMTSPPASEDRDGASSPIDPCSMSMDLRSDAFSRLRSGSLSHSRSTPDLTEITSKGAKAKRVERSNSKRLLARSRGDAYINTSTHQAGADVPTSPNRRSGVITFSPKHSIGSISSRIRASFSSSSRRSDSELPEIRNRGTRTLK